MHEISHSCKQEHKYARPSPNSAEMDALAGGGRVVLVCAPPFSSVAPPFSRLFFLCERELAAIRY
jgi:hypothetical protein